MMTVDTSALVAILLDEPKAAACEEALYDEVDLKISAATVAEAMIVATRRGRRNAMALMLSGLGLDVVPVTAASGRRAAAAYERWGKGFHAAALNFGDCFTYEVAATHGGRLLFVGDDFSQTDLTSVL